MASRKKKDPEHFISWTVQDEGSFDAVVQKGIRSKTEGKNTFHVDRAYEEQDSAETIYSDMCSAITHSVVHGTNGTVFTFGQTGGGKSYTIQGFKGAKGIIQLAAHHLFELIADDTDREYTVKASYIEIYNEQVRDLMGFEEEVDPKSRRATAVITTVNKLNVDLPVLNIREGSKGGDVFVDAQSSPVTTVASVVRVLHKGNRNRATEKTETNEFSSRSHAIFRLTVESHERLDDEAELGDGGLTVRVATLNLVDLAGSENAAKANTSGVRKREGGKINQRCVDCLDLHFCWLSLGLTH
jgi:Kinesin motor domain